MKKTLLAITLFFAPAFVLAAQTPVTNIGTFANPAKASINDLKVATNAKLEVIELNRQDHETRVAAMETGKAAVSCFADSASFNTCFALDWPTGFDTAGDYIVTGEWDFTGATVTGISSGGIVHATSDGNYYASRNGEWTSLTGVFAAPMPWLPSVGPTNGRQILQAIGGCSVETYDTQATCEANAGTWTTPVYANTSIISGLINDAGTAADDLWSAEKITTMLAAKQNTQPSSVDYTSNVSPSAEVLLNNKFITNYGASGTITIALPAVSYEISRAVLVESAQIIQITPPSGEAFDLSGTILTADQSFAGTATVGGKIVITRQRNAAGTWIWSADIVRGTWAGI